MTKICGLVSNEPCPELTRILGRMYDVSWQENHIRREMWHDTRAGLGHFNIGAVNVDPQPMFTMDGKEAIVYCGKIFDYSHLKNALRADGVRFSLKDNDAEFMLHFINQGWLGKLPQINGIYALAHWNSLKNRLTLINDRYGIRPVYYYHNIPKGVFVFSSDLRGVIESGLVPRKINWRAANVFLHFGHHLGEDTFFEGVQLLPPAAVLHFENNQVKIERYWDMAKIPIQENIRYADAVSGCVELFAQAIARRNIPTQGEKAVFLSGGLDSGRIAAELKRQGCRFTTYTARGFKQVVADVPQARKVATILGLENHFINLPQQDFWIRYFPLAAELTDYETQLHQWILPLVENLPADCKINYDGIAGDIPFNAVRRASAFIDKQAFQDALHLPVPQLALKLIPQQHNYSVWAKPLQQRLLWSDVIEKAVQELNKFAGTPNQLTCWYLMNRTRRAIAVSPLKLIALRAEGFLPYYDNDLFEFIMSLPPLMKITNNLRKDMVRQAYPDLADIYALPPKPEEGVQNDIDYHQQRRQFLRRNFKQHFIANNWIFNNYHAAPRLVADYFKMTTNPDHISYVFGLSFVVFYEFLEKYFRNGAGLFNKNNR